MQPPHSLLLQEPHADNLSPQWKVALSSNIVGESRAILLSKLTDYPTNSPTSPKDTYSGNESPDLFSLNPFFLSHPFLWPIKHRREFQDDAPGGWARQDCALESCFFPRRNGCVIDCSATTEVILVFTEEINGWTCAKTVTGKVERRGPIKTGKEV